MESFIDDFLNHNNNDPSQLWPQDMTYAATGGQHNTNNNNNNQPRTTQHSNLPFSPFPDASQHEPQAIYVSDVPGMPFNVNPYLPTHPPASMMMPHEPPAKIRKKPGRKPNPASPALRKAQNRAAQRAFRERKEKHLKDLENTIRTLRDQRNNAVKELSQAKNKLDGFKAENWYLKGVVLTLQFVCMHHNIHIPTHSPYLTEEALSEMAQSAPHAIEAYVNAYTRNNINLKPTIASHFANTVPESKDSDPEEDDTMDIMSPDDTATPHPTTPRPPHASNTSVSPSAADEYASIASASLSPTPTTVKQEADDVDMSQWLHTEEEDDAKSSQQQEQQQQQQQQREQQQREPSHEEESFNHDKSSSSLSAIQKIRLQLRVQSALTTMGKSAVRLQPTLLQLAIPHDPRIDLIPAPHMRDRMIIFRDQMDYDRCFAMLLNGAVYHGGDPSFSESWELPAEFFSEFWFLSIDYDVRKTNKWRRLKGLSEIRSGRLQEEDTAEEEKRSAANTVMWAGDDILAQFVEGMPTLQPLESKDPASHGPLHAQEDDHPLYSHLMKSPPESRHMRSPSLGAMMDLMSSLSTN
ncbi:hypothetical protein BCR43DRAFT_482223 [Syncephalastrum racemosum]|uniref:BZIP domain-containing protein n=1 Tax=Syncephalastrum racemosum TaxID=13706 RepID=A0A1X2HTD7_SYNRA|nr:hypothetical protein BCR43DRAFT_482223 [Syncephalastrum racemosum]